MAAEAALAQATDTSACPRTVLPRSGQEVSRLGLGLSRLHYLSAADGTRLIHGALDLGVTHFDTARLYGDGFSEAVLGRALAGRREGVTIATKFGLLPSGLIEAAGPLAHPLRGARSVLRRAGLLRGPRRSWSAATLRGSVERSLRALRTERVDMLFLHEPVAAELEEADDLFAELARLKASGRIGAVGLAAQAGEAGQIIARFGDAIDVLQVPEGSWQEGALAPDLTFGAIGTGVQVYGAAKPGREQVRAALRAALSRRPQGCVLVGTTKAAHLAELVALAREPAP